MSRRLLSTSTRSTPYGRNALLEAAKRSPVKVISRGGRRSIGIRIRTASFRNEVGSRVGTADNAFRVDNSLVSLFEPQALGVMANVL